jgi:hypothetical protein
MHGSNGLLSGVIIPRHVPVLCILVLLIIAAMCCLFDKVSFNLAFLYNTVLLIREKVKIIFIYFIIYIYDTFRLFCSLPSPFSAPSPFLSRSYVQSCAG